MYALIETRNVLTICKKRSLEETRKKSRDRPRVNFDFWMNKLTKNRIFWPYMQARCSKSQVKVMFILKTSQIFKNLEETDENQRYLLISHHTPSIYLHIIYELNVRCTIYTWIYANIK
jgi:hypothetical protein